MMSAVNPPAVKKQIIRKQNISKGILVKEPGGAILIEGTVSGNVFCKNIKMWRTQKAIIEATAKILIEKEIIGADGDVDLEHLEVDIEKKIIPKSDIMYMSAPEITVGKNDEQASASKKMVFNTNRLILKNICILEKVYVNLGKKFFELKKSIENNPRKFQNKINVLTRAIEADLEDFEIKARRPGNDKAKPLCVELDSVLKKSPDNIPRIVTLLRQIMGILTIVNKAEIEERWKNRFQITKNLADAEQKLERIFKKLSQLTLDLSVAEMKNGAEIIIYFGSSVRLENCSNYLK